MSNPPAPFPPLIDPMFELAPWQPNYPLSNGWFDRRRKLAFGIGPNNEDRDSPIWSFDVSHLDGDEKLGLCGFDMKRSPPGRRPVDHVHFELSRARIFSRIDDTLSDRFQDFLLKHIDELEPKYQEKVRRFGGYGRAAAYRRVVESLGGHAVFESIVVAGIRACQVVSPLAPFQTEDWARSADVLIVD